MKKLLIALSLLCVLAVLVSCNVTGNGDETTTEATVETTPGAADTTEKSDETTEGTDLPPVEENLITVSKAHEIAGSLADGAVTETRYTLRATVVTISNPTYGEMTIKDETGEIYVYGSYSADGSIGYSQMEEKPYKGDEVHISALIQNYKGTPELKSVWILDFTPSQEVVDESKYTQMSVADARKAAEGTMIETSGVVSQITYANGMIPSGFILTDASGSIYVFDGNVAARVRVGNTVTVLASKTWWILSTEATNAEKFGYKGCCQLTEATMTANDNKVSDFSTAAVTETTVKAIMETPVTEDITSSVFKVTALVKKAPGNGFTNYYIDDLDGKTGSYAYSQCNGSDYAWLDAFDGKICTVYLVPLNAKSSSTGCVWRFLPVKVVDEGFKFNPADAGKFAVDYFVLDQFEESYAADPAKELVTSVSSELLGLNGVAISYASDNTKVVTIENGVLHAKGNGTATVTITATYAGQTPYTAKVTVKVEAPESYNSIGVKEAIAANVGDVITVKDVVGSSLVNQAGGFYLIDDNGIIAVKFDVATDISQISVGDEIIITGKRDAYSQKNGYPGQVCITAAKLDANMYGAHSYSTASFITDKNFDYLYTLADDVYVDHTTETYVIDVKITSSSTAYASNYYLVDPNNADHKITLYCSSGNQYSFLAPYVDQTVKIEVALCNWNAKSPYKACVLSVINADGSKVINQLNFQSK